MRGRSLGVLLAAVAIGSCATTPPGAARQADAVRDTSSAQLIPAGFGTLRQDELAIRLQPPGLIVRAIPLDEALIRLLTPDSYRTLNDLRTSSGSRLAAISRRLGGRQVAPWLVSFFGVEPEVRFSPLDLIVTSAGRDFRALEIIPLSAGFGEQRLRQRETQTAIFVFEAEINLNQPLTVTFANERNELWEHMLPRVERERALVRARATRGAQP